MDMRLATFKAADEAVGWEGDPFISYCLGTLAKNMAKLGASSYIQKHRKDFLIWVWGGGGTVCNELLCSTEHYGTD